MPDLAQLLDWTKTSLSQATTLAYIWSEKLAMVQSGLTIKKRITGIAPALTRWFFIRHLHVIVREKPLTSTLLNRTKFEFQAKIGTQLDLGLAVDNIKNWILLIKGAHNSLMRYRTLGSEKWLFLCVLFNKQWYPTLKTRGFASTFNLYRSFFISASNHLKWLRQHDMGIHWPLLKFLRRAEWGLFVIAKD